MELRGWQSEAFAQYVAERTQASRELLWEATPGAGKTIAALAVVRHELQRRLSERVLVVVPTAHLRSQWARAARNLGLHLDSSFGGPRAAVSRDFHGAVITYQQLGMRPRELRSLATRAVVVLDEVHHAGEGLAWGNAVRAALQPAGFVLALSGTPFRSDNNPIPFVHYDADGVSAPNFSYSYSRAVSEEVCRPTAVFSYGGQVQWCEQDRVLSADFTDALDSVAAARRLRVALDPESGWIQPMLRDAHEMLVAVRREQSDAGGLVVCADQDHARALAGLLTAVAGERPTVVLSDDATASRKIRQFSASREMWIVACNMVSEGVDLPRLRVGVYATTVRTKLYFRQFVGRIVRRQVAPAGLQVAYLYMPSDPALLYLAQEIESECRHILTRPSHDQDDERRERRKDDEDVPAQAWQSVGGINSGLASVIVHGNQLALFGGALPTEQVRQVVHDELSLHIEERKTRSEVKAELAREIQRLVGLVHRRRGLSHAQVHSELNRLQRVRSQVHCTEVQLRDRVMLAQKMLQRGGQKP